MNTCWIVTRFVAPGLHVWPNAPQTRDYLGVEHRHLFHVELRIEAPADNARSFEFHDVRDVARRCFRDLGYPPNDDTDLVHYADSSCEMLATDLIAKVVAELQIEPRRRLTCSVFEDGENGAIVERHADLSNVNLQGMVET